MKRIARITLAVAFVALVVVAFAGCKKATAPWESMDLTFIMDSPYRVSIPVNATSSNLSISAIHSKAGMDNLAWSGGLKTVTNNLSFKSSNGKIAIVTAGGQITGIAPGTAFITVSYTEGNTTKTVDVPVTVTAPPET